MESKMSFSSKILIKSTDELATTMIHFPNSVWLSYLSREYVTTFSSFVKKLNIESQ